MTKILLVLLLSASVLCQVAQYQISYYNGESCVSAGSGCRSCYSSDGQFLSYMSIYENPNDVTYYNSSQYCYSGTYQNAIQGSCDSSHAKCTVFYTASYVLDELVVSSTSPLKVFFGPSDYDESKFGHISSTSAVIKGTVKQTFIESNGQTVHIIKKVSATEYVTNLGIMNIGQQYTKGSMTFTFNTQVSNTPPPLPPTIPQSGVEAIFYPFAGIDVTNSSKTVKFGFNEFEMVLFANNEETGFMGVDLTNPFFGVNDMQLFPPYNDNYYGTWVFQFESASGFRALPAYYSASGDYRIYECGFSISLDFSGPLGWWWLHNHLSGFPGGSFSFSFLDVEDYARLTHPQNVDSMAFELF